MATVNNGISSKHMLIYLLPQKGNTMNTQTTMTQRISRQARSSSLVNLAMNINRNYDDLLQKIAQDKQPEPVVMGSQVEVQNGKQSLNFSAQKIQWVEAAGDYLFVHTEEGKPQLIRKTMKAMEDILDSSQFIRIHRSYIVNIDQVKQFGNNANREKIITLKNDQTLSVSRRFKTRVAAMLTA